MRKLKTSDIFAAARLIKALGIKEKLRATVQQARDTDNDDDARVLGFDVIFDIIESAATVSGENAVYAFLAGPMEMEAAEIRDLDATKFMELLKQLAEENNLLDFGTAVAQLIR